MTYKAHIKNGVAVLDDNVVLPDGLEVRLVPVTDVAAGGESTIWKKLLDLAGTVEGLPADAARQHDHYLYGTPKR